MINKMDKIDIPPQDLRKAQMLMLHILKKVHEICEKLNRT